MKEKGSKIGGYVEETYRKKEEDTDTTLRKSSGESVESEKEGKAADKVENPTKEKKKERETREDLPIRKGSKEVGRVARGRS